MAKNCRVLFPIEANTTSRCTCTLVSFNYILLESSAGGFVLLFWPTRILTRSPHFLFSLFTDSLSQKKKTGRTMFFPQLRNYLSFFNCGLKSPFSKWKGMLRNRLVRMSMTNPTSTHHTRFEPLPHYRETP